MIGLLCAADGCPVAVGRFYLQRVVLVGDRGPLTDARINETLRPAGLDWITALRAPAIKALAAEGGRLQPSLFDTRDPRLRKGKHGGDHQSGLSR